MSIMPLFFSSSRRATTIATPPPPIPSPWEAWRNTTELDGTCTTGTLLPSSCERTGREESWVRLERVIGRRRLRAMHNSIDACRGNRSSVLAYAIPHLRVCVLGATGMEGRYYMGNWYCLKRFVPSVSFSLHFRKPQSRCLPY